MLIDPDLLLPLEDLIEKAFSAMPPAAQARIKAFAAREGITRDDAMMYFVQKGYEWVTDPAHREQYERECEFYKYPFGRDPLHRMS